MELRPQEMIRAGVLFSALSPFRRGSRQQSLSSRRLSKIVRHDAQPGGKILAPAFIRKYPSGGMIGRRVTCRGFAHNGHDRERFHDLVSPSREVPGMVGHRVQPQLEGERNARLDLGEASSTDSARTTRQRPRSHLDVVKE